MKGKLEKKVMKSMNFMGESKEKYSKKNTVNEEQKQFDKNRRREERIGDREKKTIRRK